MSTQDQKAGAIRQKPRVKTSDTALQIIELIAFTEEAMTQTEIAKAIGMVKSAVHKHLYTLEEMGWIVRDRAGGHYGLGPKAWLVGERATGIQNLARTAMPYMRAARDETGLAVVLSLVNRESLSVVAALHGTHSIEIGVRQGSQLTLHASAQGRLVLALNDTTMREQVLSGDLSPLTPRTITDPDILRDRLAEIAEAGYAVAPEQTLLGVNVIAAPVRNYAGNLVATVALVGSIQHLTEPPTEAHVATILHLAQSISREHPGHDR